MVEDSVNIRSAAVGRAIGRKPNCRMLRPLTLSLDLIKSSTIKSRTDGLAELKQAFLSNSQGLKVESLRDDQYHVIFEALFTCVWTERSGYLKAKGAVIKSSAASRLASCASTLRTVVEIGIKALEFKTVNALLDHIIQALEQADHGLCEPLVDDYSKTLRAILDHQPHVEHFHPRGKTPGKWKDVAIFCLDAVRVYADATELNTSFVSNGHSPANTQSNGRRAGKSFTSQAGTRSSTTSSPCFEFIVCIRKLVEAPNAPVATYARELLSTLTEFLLSTTAVGRGHLDAFAAINCVFLRITNSLSDVMRQATQELLPVIKECWSSKRTSLKEELMRTTLLVTPFILAINNAVEPSPLEDDVESLLETILAEYTRRHERDLLHMDDLELFPKQTRARRPSYLCTFDLKGTHESQFTGVYLMASLSKILDSARRNRSQRSIKDELGHNPTKKPRFGTVLEDYTRRLTLCPPVERLAILQIQSFYVAMAPLSSSDISSIVTRLISQLGDSHHGISSWAMLCLSNCALHKEASAPVLKESWMTVWQAASRCISAIPTSRAACHVLNVLLKTGVIEYSSISRSVEAMFSATEVNGPATLCEASLSLWVDLMNRRLAENPSSGSVTINRILQWLFGKWTPSQSLS